MMEFPSYPKVYNLGHRDIADLLKGTVVVQEKVDGSQINWTWDHNGNLHVKSKGSWQYGGPDGRVEPDKIFAPAVQHLLRTDPMPPGVFYRGETLASPRHNALAYDRVPKGHIVLFDATTLGWEPSSFLLAAGALAMEIEVVQHIAKMDGSTVAVARLDAILESYEPALGGRMMEGIVFKNYGQFDAYGRPLMGKYVAPAFREIHKSAKPTKENFVQDLIESLNTEARFEKAVQHLRDEGRLDDSPKDIGALMVEVKRDTLDEARPYILEQLEKHFMKEIERGIGRGLPEWYKQRLTERQFA